tara:strand:- start:152 stop:481 length:330 start_codon:yes stop_codon:yes gene_type:complete
MITFISFNTDRPYTKEGQQIECALINAEPYFIDEPELGQLYTVVLEDYSRGISAVLSVSEFSENAIMRAYDTSTATRYPTIEQDKQFLSLKIAGGHDTHYPRIAKHGSV